MVYNAFILKNGTTCYKFVGGYKFAYFIKNASENKTFDT